MIVQQEPIMAEQGKYYFKQYPGFRVSSGVTIKQGGDKGRTTDWVTITDDGQGIGFYRDGLSRIKTKKTSLDLCGEGCKEDEPAKIIQAENGAIIIEALFGDIVLKGRNVRIMATAHDGEVTVVSPKHFHVKAAIQNMQGTNINILAAKDLTSCGTQVTSTAGLNHNSSTLGDEKKGSFLTKLLALFDKAKKFLEGDLGL